MHEPMAHAVIVTRKLTSQIWGLNLEIASSEHPAIYRQIKWKQPQFLQKIHCIAIMPDTRLKALLSEFVLLRPYNNMNWNNSQGEKK